MSLGEAAEKGTHKVITEHSTIGIVVTTDGTVCDIPRENYLEAEERVIKELKEIGKPFAVLLNSTEPQSETAQKLADEISRKYSVLCIAVNCLKLTEEDVGKIMQRVLMEFPVKSIGFFLPEWLDALSDDNELKAEIFMKIYDDFKGVSKIKDCCESLDNFRQFEKLKSAEISRKDLGEGSVFVDVQLPRALY